MNYYILKIEIVKILQTPAGIIAAGCILIGLIIIGGLIYQNTGERGAAKRAEREYRWRKYYEIKDEVDEIERDLIKKTAEFEAELWKGDYMNQAEYERVKAAKAKAETEKHPDNVITFKKPEP